MKISNFRPTKTIARAAIGAALLAATVNLAPTCSYCSTLEETVAPAIEYVKEMIAPEPATVIARTVKVSAPTFENLPEETPAQTLEVKTIEKAEEEPVTPPPRYANASFGELLDFKYCVDESEVVKICEEACAEVGCKYITPEVLESVAYQESKFVKEAQNGTATGMFQFKPHFHQTEMEQVGVTESDLEDAKSQALVAACILETYAENRVAKGVDPENAARSAVMDYHLTVESANKAVKAQSWDYYCRSVFKRADVIAESKAQSISNDNALESLEHDDMEV